MLTLAVMALIVPMLAIREQSVNQYIAARNDNLARTIARDLLTELEFHDLDSRGGQIDGQPGFTYQLDIEEVDLVTGEGDPEAEKREKDKQAKRAGDDDSSSRFKPSDAQGGKNDELQELVDPVRKVKLTLKYPNLREDAKEPNQLVIETILPALPEAIEEHNKKMNSPFGSDRAKK